MTDSLPIPPLDSDSPDNAPTPAPAKRPLHKTRSARSLVWLLSFGVLLLLGLGVLMGLLSSEKGQHFLLRQADKFLEQIQFGSASGSLQKGLHLTNVRVNVEGVDVNVAQATVQLQPACLWSKHVCLDELSLVSPDIAIDTSKLPASDPNQADQPFEMPVTLIAKKLAVDDLRLTVDRNRVELGQFRSALFFNDKRLDLSPTTVKKLNVILAETQTKKNDKAPRNNAIDWNALRDTFSKPLLNKNEPIQLPFMVNIPDFRLKDATISQYQGETPAHLVAISRLLLKGEANEYTVSLKQFEVSTDQGSLSGKGALTLDQNYPLNWTLNAQLPEVKSLGLAKSQANLTLKGALFNRLWLNGVVKGGLDARLRGDLSLTQAKTPFNLTLNSGHFHFPFNGKATDRLNLNQTALQLKGNLLNYQLTAKTSTGNGLYVPKGQWQFTGDGGLDRFNIKQLSASALEGKAVLSGFVSWKSGVEWESKLTASQLNTAHYLPEWPAKLSGYFESKGFAARGKTGEEWGVKISKMDINGTLSNKALTLKGDLETNAKQWLNVPSALLIYGENRIALKGTLGAQNADFNAELNAPNLSGLIPQFSAGLLGHIHLSGKPSAPNLDLDLTAQNVRYAEYQLKKLLAKGKITTQGSMVGDLALQLSNFSMDGVQISEASGTLKGSEKQHQLQINAQGTPVGLSLSLNGGFDRAAQRWQGNLKDVDLTLKLRDFQERFTSNGFALSYTHPSQQATLSAHCWQNPQLAFCFPQSVQVSKQNGYVPFEIKQFDLATLKGFLPSGTALLGNVQLNGNAQWSNGNAPSVDAELRSALIQLTQGGFPLRFMPVSLKAKMANNQLQLLTDLRVANNGHLQSNMLVSQLDGARQLSGTLALDQFTLDLLAPLLNGERLNGNLNGNLRLGGALSQPQLFGQININKIGVKSPSLPVYIDNGQMQMNFTGSHSTLSGKLYSKENSLTVSGEADWANLNRWYTQVNAKSDRFRFQIPAIAKVDITADISARATPEQLYIDGTVNIPWARIQVNEMPPSAVTVSSDEVIFASRADYQAMLKQEQAQKQQAESLLQQNNLPASNPMLISGDVKIALGDDVTVDAYGLKAHLGGTLQARQGRKGLGLFGQVKLEKGSYNSFGQDLVIRKGIISFTGLASQPMLDIEAIRNPEAMEVQNVTAGVKVTGMVDKPSVKVFSSPSMAQDQALSYILTGRSLENSGDTMSRNSASAALIGMGLAQGSKFVGGIGNTFGISDLSVTTAGIGDNTKVVVSGNFLSPRFKVKYGVGIFAPLTELTLRYRLAPQLYLQWVSSISQTIDLIYQFDFD